MMSGGVILENLPGIFEGHFDALELLDLVEEVVGDSLDPFVEFLGTLGQPVPEPFAGFVIWYMGNALAILRHSGVNELVFIGIGIL